MTLLTHPALLIALRLLMAMIFMSAAIGKMRHWRVFEGVVANYRLLPDALDRLVAWLLPPAEALLAIALIAGIAQPWSACMAATLLVVFALAIGINLIADGITEAFEL